MGQFEDDLEQLCDHLAEKRDLSLRTRDIAGRGINRSQSYLKKVLRIDVPDGGNAWAEIRRLARIRNVLAHRGGRLDLERDADLPDWIQQKGIGVVEAGDVVLDASAHTYAVGVMREFWRQLFDRVRDWSAANGA